MPPKPALRALAAAAALALALLPGAAPAQDELARHLGPLAGIVDLGNDGTWEAAVEGGWFTLANESDPGAVTYYWVEADEAASGRYEAGMTLVLRAEGGGTSYAGMLFNYRAGDQYLGIVVGSDGGTYAIIRTPEGFNLQPATAEGVTVRGDGSDVLTATVDGGLARFALNGATILEISNSQNFSTQLGIIAVGTGLFGFTGFRVTAGP